MKWSFLDKLGEPKESYTEIKVGGNDLRVAEYLDILVARNQMMQDFKDEILNLYLSKKISISTLNSNIATSVNAHNGLKIKVLSIDETAFKERGDKLEYVGAIPKLPENKQTLNPSSGKVSYNFAKMLCDKLSERVMLLGEIIQLSDILDFKVLRIINLQRLD